MSKGLCTVDFSLDTTPMESGPFTGLRRKGAVFCRRLSLALVLLLVGAASSSAATIVVDSTADAFHGVCTPGNCTLKDAVFVAENTGGSNTIVLQNCAFYLLTSAYNAADNAFPTVTSTLSIIGNGATIDRAASAPLFRFFHVATGGALTLENLLIANGMAQSGSAVYNEGTLSVTNSVLANNGVVGHWFGGAIFNYAGGTVNIAKSTLRNNTAETGGALWSFGGSTEPIPVNQVSNVTITDSAFVNNTAATFGGGVDISDAHNLAITNTTFSGNIASFWGGGIDLATLARSSAAGPLSVSLGNLTVVDNTAVSRGGGIAYSICGLTGCPKPAQVPLSNTIVANNTAPTDPDVFCNSLSGLISAGYNLIGQGCCFSSTATDRLAAPLVDLGALTTTGDAGGEHHRPLSGCPAINMGLAPHSSTDQLGLPRLLGDIGAVEHRDCFQISNAAMEAWWQFEETASPAIDGTGNPLNIGTWLGSPAPSPGMVGSALSFNGVNQKVRVKNNPSIDFSNNCDALTIDAWVKTCASGLQVVVDKRVLSFPFFAQGYSLFIFNGRLGFQLAVGPTFSNYLAPAANLNNNRWHLVAVTITRCGIPKGIMYVDGAPVFTFAPLLGNISNPANLLIGAGYITSTVTSSFNGSIDEPEIFKRSLKPLEIKALFNAGWAGKCPCGGNPSTCRLSPEECPANQGSVAILDPPGFPDRLSLLPGALDLRR